MATMTAESKAKQLYVYSVIWFAGIQPVIIVIRYDNHCMIQLKVTNTLSECCLWCPDLLNI